MRLRRGFDVTNVAAMGAAAAPPYTQTEYTYSGAYQTKTISTGWADGTDGILSIWIRLNGGNGSLQTFLTPSGGRVELSRTSADKYQFILRNSGGTSLVNLTTDPTYTTASGKIHILSSWSLVATPLFHFLVDGVDISKTFSTSPTAGTIDYLRAVATGIGATNAGASQINASIGDLYFNAAEYLDLTNPANVAKFRDGSGNPVSLGTNGETPTGSQPAIYIGNGMTASDINAGNIRGLTGTGWTATGTVT